VIQLLIGTASSNEELQADRLYSTQTSMESLNVFYQKFLFLRKDFRVYCQCCLTLATGACPGANPQALCSLNFKQCHCM